MALEWHEGESGLGAVLMSAAGLTRHENGQPHQAVYHFDETGAATRLAESATGQPLGYDYDDDGQPFLDEDALIPLPSDVAAAARRWIEAAG